MSIDEVMGGVRVNLWRDGDGDVMVSRWNDSRSHHDDDDLEDHRELMVDPAVWEWLSTPMEYEDLLFDDWDESVPESYVEPWIAEMIMDELAFSDWEYTPEGGDD